MIKLDKVNLSFDNKVVMQDFSLMLEAKGVTCITGRSGCGKTTLLKVIAGLIKPQSGLVEVPFTKTAFMFQEDRLLPWVTVRQNILAVLPAADIVLADSFLEAVELKGEANSYPESLSGGMRRRVSFARTLAFGGDLLILDEPFKGLDSGLIKKLAAVISAQHCPVLAITHSYEEIDLLGGKMIKLDGPPLTII